MGRILTGLAGAVWVLLAAACGRPGPERGQPVADGVARGTLEVRANATDLVEVTVLFPADAEGRPAGRALPTLLFIQGGAVVPSRYEWMGLELARRGFVVALPRHPLDLAFFGIGHGAATRAALLSPEPGSLFDGLVDERRLAVGGHSLGGVVALKLGLGGGFGAVLVEASFPDPADHAKLASSAVPTLFLAAKQDCQAKEAQVRAGWEKVPSPTALVVLDGVTHFQFTDSQAEDERRGCAPAAGLEAAHERIIAATHAFLSAALANPASLGEGSLRAVPGAEVETR